MIVLITKFTHGAWIVVFAMPAVFWAATAIRRHYDQVDAELRLPPAGSPCPVVVHAVVLVSRLHTPTLRPGVRTRYPAEHLVALTVRSNPIETAALEQEWIERDIPVPLVTLDSLHRDLT